LHPVAGSRHQSERAIGLQANLFALPGPQPERRGMASVDNACRRTRQVNPHEQAGNELAVVRLLGQRIIRQPRLLGQLYPPPTGVS
jgi:hypothetical protein